MLKNTINKLLHIINVFFENKFNNKLHTQKKKAINLNKNNFCYLIIHFPFLIFHSNFIKKNLLICKIFTSIKFYVLLFFFKHFLILIKNNQALQCDLSTTIVIIIGICYDDHSKHYF